MSSEPRLIGAEELRARLPMAAAIDALETAFRTLDAGARTAPVDRGDAERLAAPDAGVRRGRGRREAGHAHAVEPGARGRVHPGELRAVRCRHAVARGRPRRGRPHRVADRRRLRPGDATPRASGRRQARALRRGRPGESPSRGDVRRATGVGARRRLSVAAGGGVARGGRPRPRPRRSGGGSRCRRRCRPDLHLHDVGGPAVRRVPAAARRPRERGRLPSPGCPGAGHRDDPSREGRGRDTGRRARRGRRAGDPHRRRRVSPQETWLPISPRRSGACPSDGLRRTSPSSRAWAWRSRTSRSPARSSTLPPRDLRRTIARMAGREGSDSPRQRHEPPCADGSGDGDTVPAESPFGANGERSVRSEKGVGG